TFAGAGADGQDGNIWDQRLDLFYRLPGPVAQITLVQHQDRLDMGSRSGGQVTLEASRVQVAVERSNQEQGVEIGGDDLFVNFVAGDLAGELVEPGQHGVDHRLLVVRGLAQDYPIADGREIRPVAGFVPQAAADRSPAFAPFGVEAIQFLVFRTDPAGKGL